MTDLFDLPYAEDKMEPDDLPLSWKAVTVILAFAAAVGAAAGLFFAWLFRLR